MDKRYGSIYVDKHNDGTKDLSRHKKDSFYWYKDVLLSMERIYNKNNYWSLMYYDTSLSRRRNL